MPYTEAYTIRFLNYDPSDQTETDVYFNLYNNQSYTDDPIDQAYTELEASGNPLNIEFIDSNEDIFTPIRGRRVAARFLANVSFDINTFSFGPDSNWLAEVIINNNTYLFKGFLVLDDLSMRFISADARPEVLLLSTDQLALLSDVEWNDDGERPQGKYSLIEIISMCLLETGRSLPINLVNSIYLDGGTTDDNWHKLFLDARTFQDEVNKFENCKSVLEKILEAFGAFLCMHVTATRDAAEWWIYAVDDFRHLNYTRHEYSSVGGYSGFFNETANITIGSGEPISMDQTELSGRRPVKSVVIKYDYEYPPEIVCNIDFSRGDLIATISPTEKHYDIECWTLQKGSPLSPPGSPDIDAYIVRTFNGIGYEDERYILLTPASTNAGSDANRQYLNSEPIEIHEKDKFYTSVDWRLASTLSGGTQPIIFRCVLHGDDDSWWILGNTDFDPDTYGQTDYQWYDTSGWTTATAAGNVPVVGADLDEVNWTSLSWDAPPAPVTGKLYLQLHQFNHEVSSADNLIIHFSNLSFNYIPYINGSYQRYSGHEHKFEQSDSGYKEVIEKQVYIAEGIKKLFKGALHYFDGSEYQLAEDFENIKDSTGFGTTRHGKLLANQYWNQYRDLMRKFDANLIGIMTDSENVPGLCNKYYLEDSHLATRNKYFMAVTAQTNLRNGLWRAILWEVYDTVRGYEWDENKYSFRYLQ